MSSFASDALLAQFRKLRGQWRFTSLEAVLFYELVWLCQEADGASEFPLPTTVVCAALGCSEPSLLKARATLQQAGLLAFTLGNRSAPSTYRLLLKQDGQLTTPGA